MKKCMQYSKLIQLFVISLIAFSVLSIGRLSAQIEPDLEVLLEDLNDGYTSVNGIIPNRFDFSEGETGYYIYDGGSNMYWYGNEISTDLGAYVYYSNNQITSSSHFGGEGKYFTRKYPGLFVLSANLSGVSEFSISGDLDNWGGTVDGTELTSGMYRGFVKRVYNTSSSNSPSVNHLIIVKDDPAVEQTYSSSAYSDNHSLTSLGNTTRIYFLLYAGTNGYYINDAATQQIMDAFVSLLRVDTVPPNPVSDLIVSNILNSGALMSWTAPSDDSLTEPVSAYDVRISASPITSGNYFSATEYEQSIVPGNPGTTEVLTITGLQSETQYWAGLRSIDEGENYSSAVITMFTTGSDPSIAVSDNSIDFDIPLGEATTGSITISNTVSGSSPLAYSIEVDNDPANDIMTYLIGSYGEMTSLNMLTQDSETIDLGITPTQIEYSKASDDIWVSSTGSDQIYVVSGKTNSIRLNHYIEDLFRVCVPEEQSYVYVLYSTYPMVVRKYDAESLTYEDIFNLGNMSQPDDARLTADGSKLCVLDWYDFYVFDASDGTLLNNFDLGDYYGTSFILSDDGAFAYCRYYHSVIRLNLQTGNIQVRNFNSEIGELAFAPDGNKLFIGYYSKDEINVLNAETMQQISVIKKGNGYPTSGLHVSADGNKLYCLNYNSPGFMLIDIATSEVEKSYSQGYYYRNFTFPGGYDDY
nr:hypothetical protein [Bacteroidota bacterium]